MWAVIGLSCLLSFPSRGLWWADGYPGLEFNREVSQAGDANLGVISDTEGDALRSEHS